MTNTNSDPTTKEESTDENDSGRLPLTRRQTIAALASAGVLGTAASAQSSDPETVASIGGGSMSDPLQEFTVKPYVMTWSEYQNQVSPGVEGRVITIEDDTEPDHDGKVLYDDGSSIELVDRQYGSLSAEQTHITSDVIRAHFATGYEDYKISDYGDDILSACQTAVDNGAKHIELPSKGEFLSGTTLTIDNADDFGGITSPSHGKPIIRTAMAGAAIEVQSVDNLTLSGFTLKHGNTTDYAINWLTGNDSSDCNHIHDMEFLGDFTAALHSEGDQNPYSSTISNCRFTNNTVGIDFAVAGVSNEYRTLWFEHFGSQGLVLGNRSQTVVNCNFGSDQDPFNCILIGNGGGNASGITIDNCNFEEITDPNNNITGTGVTVTGPWVDVEIRSPVFKNIQAGVRTADDGQTDDATVRVRGAKYIQQVPTKINASNLATGFIHYLPYKPIDVFNDPNNRVVGMQTNGKPAWRGNDGRRVSDYAADVALFSGDGSATSFTVPHSLPGTPRTVLLTMESPSSNGEAITDYDKDGTNITVNFDTAPAAGTDNVRVSWRAEM